MAKTSADKKYIRASIENVQTNQITISEDKLRIKLNNQIKRIKNGCGVISYFCLAITCISVLVTADMKTAFGLTPDMLKTVFFIIAAGSSFLGLLRAFHFVFYKVTVDTIVKDIKTADKEDVKLSLWEKLRNIIDSKMNNNSEKEEKAE